jgi:nitrate reductase assembly molybdenum cofactor insertion protein NarJ
MMTTPVLTQLQPLAVALGYPDAHWQAALAALETAFREHLPELTPTWTWLIHQDLIPLQSLYVATFDFDPKTSLTLSAHLPSRVAPGPALARCIQAVRDSGYALPGPAWADHLPTLLEYLAVAEKAPAEIATWVGTAFAEIAHHLPREHPYRPLITWVTQVLPSLPEGGAKSGVEPLESVEAVPFPVRYD